MRIHRIVLVASREGHEALRSRWFLVASASFLVLSLGLSMLGLAGAQRSGMAGFDRTTASLMNLVLVFAPMLTLTLGAMGFAGDLEDGALAMLLAQPVTRLEVYLGKFLGLLLAVVASVLAGFGATGLLVSASAGGGDVASFLALAGLTVLLCGATLALGTLLSVALETRARALGGAFAVWLVLVYLSDLGTIYLAVARALAPGQVFCLALLNPVQQARVLGTMALTSRLSVLGPVGVFGLDHFGATGLAAVLTAALVAGTLLPLALGYAVFRRQAIT